MVLGFGRHTTEWFEQLPPPKNDGQVLVIQIDSKGTPTATEEELNKRRGAPPELVNVPNLNVIVEKINAKKRKKRNDEKRATSPKMLKWLL